MLGAFYVYEKDLLREYHYRLLKCFESAQRTTDAELCVLLSKRRMADPERFWLRNLYGILDHGNICGIEISLSQQTFVGLEDALKTSSTRLQRNNFTSSKTS